MSSPVGVATTSSTAAVVVDLASGTATGEGSDLLSGIANVTGSNYGDTISGDANNNALSGGAGNDTLSGGFGDDVLDGGSGTDTVDYSSSPNAVSVDLGAGSATGEGADTLSGLENVVGSPGADVINVRQGTINAVVCGAGADSVTADVFDSIAGDCESVAYPAPTVTTTAATAVTKQSATLHGSVNPN